VTGLRLLADENIDPRVTDYLRDAGFDVMDVIEAGLRGRPDQQGWPASSTAPSSPTTRTSARLRSTNANR